MRVARYVTFTCEWCGNVSERYQRPSRVPPKFCSQECRGFGFRGVKHTAKQIESRTKAGAANPKWLGDRASQRAGRTRAKRMYPVVGPCESCGAKKAERHHSDSDTRNNALSNIKILCRRCHMVADGRLVEATGRIRKVQPQGVAARWSGRRKELR